MNEFLFPSGWTQFLVGGLIIGLGVSAMFVLTGRVVGLSSFFSSSWSWVSRLPYFQDETLRASRVWRACVAAGLVLGTALWWWLCGPDTALSTNVSALRLLLGGVLVGFGARLSNGCTSGHGICGLSALSSSALLAVLVFMGAAMVTANAVVFFTGVAP